MAISLDSKPPSPTPSLVCGARRSLLVGIGQILGDAELINLGLKDFHSDFRGPLAATVVAYKRFLESMNISVPACCAFDLLQFANCIRRIPLTKDCARSDFDFEFAKAQFDECNVLLRRILDFALVDNEREQNDFVNAFRLCGEIFIGFQTEFIRSVASLHATISR